MKKTNKNNMIIEVLEDKSIVEKKKNKDLNSLINEFFLYCDVSKKSLESYKKNLKNFIIFLKENNIKEPTREDIKNYKEYLINNVKPTTAQAYLTTVKLFFKFLQTEFNYENVADRIKAPKISKEHKKDYLTSEQVKELLSNIDQSTEQGARDYAITLLMVTNGLRTIEVERANIEDIRTKGDKQVLYIQGKGRTEKNEIAILPYITVKAIKKYLKFRKNKKESDPLFTSISRNNQGKALTTRAIRGIIKNELLKIGIESDKLTAHSLRHTAVTLALLNGSTLEQVQQFARHSNINTTMIYNHSLDKMNNNCSNVLSNILK